MLANSQPRQATIAGFLITICFFGIAKSSVRKVQNRMVAGTLTCMIGDRYFVKETSSKQYLQLLSDLVDFRTGSYSYRLFNVHSRSSDWIL
jgi:hypothetical protein